jgi:hypothetical protein
MAEDISSEELANALAELAPKLAEEAMVVNDPQLQKIVKSIAPNIKSIESTLKEGVAFKSTSFAAVFQPLVNVFTKPIFDIRKTLSNSITSLTDKITKPFKDVRNFLNKPIFNIKDTFKKAFGGVRNLFGLKTKEQKEEAERNNPARAIIRYMKKSIEPLLKKIAGVRAGGGEDEGGLLSMLKNIAGLGGLTGVIATLGKASAALATAVGSFTLGRQFFDNVVSPAMDRAFQRNIDAMNEAYTNTFTQRTNAQGEAVGLDKEGRVTTDPDKMDSSIVDRRSGVSPFAYSLGAVKGARVVAPLAEFAKKDGLSALFSRYISPINELEGLIYDQALKMTEAGGGTQQSKKALLKLVVDYKDTISKLGKDDVIIKSLGRGGKAKLDAIVKAIKNSPFYKSVTDAQIMETTSSGIGTTGRIAGVQVGKISDVDRRNMGVESAPFVAEVFARREIAQQVENELAYLSGRSGSSVPNSPVIVQSNPTSITNPTENYFTSGLAPELSPMEQMLFRPLPPGFGVLQPQ